MLLLRDKDKQRLIQIFSAAGAPIEVWAYGSRVNGSAHEGSDLDLAIRSNDLQKLPINLFLDIKEKIQNSNIPILVDIFDWARLPEAFHRNIEAQHEVLFSNLEMWVNEPQAEYNKNKKKLT